MPTLSPWLLMSGTGMVLVAVLGALVVTRSARAMWRPLAIGAAAWVVAVLLKVGWALPTNTIVRQGLLHAAGTSLGRPLFWVYIGLLTGIFECGITYVIVARTKLREADWATSLAFGIGFGATEAFVLGALSLIGMAAAILFHQFLPQATQARLAAQLAGRAEFLPLMLPILERAGTLFVHAFSCVAIVYGFRTRRVWSWFALAFVYKSAVDGVAAWGLEVFKPRESVAGLTTVELWMLPFAIVGFAGLVWLRRRMKARASAGR
jgi:uncharacterized membrane protein YhfC